VSRTKVSDRDKGWIKPRHGKERDILPSYHLIVTEGEKTEPFYFKALKQAVNGRFPGRIEIEIHGEGYNTLGLLERAERYVHRAPNRPEHVWLVYDRDDFPADDFDNTEKSCLSLSNEDTTYHALWSNQCVELWFLLHFEYMHSDILRESYSSKLTKHLGRKYEKNQADIYDRLRPRLDTAIQNARQLINEYDGNQPPSQMAPATKVYEIFEMLERYIQ